MADRGRAVTRDVLSMNRAFYEAFVNRDMDAMEELWAKDVSVACIHPGWSALRGRAQVIASWRSILASDTAPRVTCANASVHLLGDAAFVICEEHVGEDRLVATNVFVREGAGWKLAHHQAAPMAQESFRTISEADTEDSGTLN
jgi:ketosteroid isomerase-like protein